jgi:hypothetical protein
MHFPDVNRYAFLLEMLWICSDRCERSDNGFDGDVKGGGNTSDALRIAIRAVFQGAYFIGRQAAGDGKLIDRISGEIARRQNLSGERSICFVIGIELCD